jgi:hypothetical protein
MEVIPYEPHCPNRKPMDRQRNIGTQRDKVVQELEIYQIRLLQLEQDYQKTIRVARRSSKAYVHIVSA